MRKKKRRFRYLLHKHLLTLFSYPRRAIQLSLSELEESEYDTFMRKDRIIEYKECLEFYSLGDEFELNNDIMEVIIGKYYVTSNLDRAYLNKKPIKEGRDNKGVYVGGGNGGYRGNTVRYPKKKRSKKTWSNFYKLFPSLAEKDGWDGKTSKRMK